MDRLLSFFLTHKKFVQLIIALILLSGGMSLRQINRQSLPVQDFSTVQVVTVSPGSSPEDVEINITTPLEDKFLEIENIERIESTSLENMSVIYLSTIPGSEEPAVIGEDVQAAIDTVTNLPNTITMGPKMTVLGSSHLPVIEIALSGNVKEALLRQITLDLEERIKTLPGVGVIKTKGLRDKELHIDANPEKLDKYHLSLKSLIQAIKNKNVRQTGGTLESFVSEKNIVTFSEYQDLDEVKDVIIQSNFVGNHVKVSDVAKVKEAFEEPTELNRANGKRAMSLIIHKQKHSDDIKISDSVHRIVEEFEKTIPKEISINIIKDESIKTKTWLNMLFQNGIIGFLLVLVVLTLFLDFKSAFWTAFGVPLSLMGTFFTFKMFNLTLDLITLASIVLVIGIIVDDAIVIVENIAHHRESESTCQQAALKGVKEVMWPVLTAIFTTALAFLPILFMTGDLGRVVYSLPIVVVSLLTFSLIDALFLLPSHVSNLKKLKETSIRIRMVNLMRRIYAWFVRGFLRLRFLFLIAIAAGLFYGFQYAGSLIKFVLMDTSNPSTIWVILETDLGNTLSITEEKVEPIEKIVKDTIKPNELRSFTTRIGNHTTSMYGRTSEEFSHYALINIHLVPAHERETTAEEYIDTLRGKLKNFKGFSKIEIVPYDDGPIVGQPVMVTFYSNRHDKLLELESSVIKYLKSTKGVYNIESNHRSGKQEMHLILDDMLMAQYSITAQDVATTLRSAFNGHIATSIHLQGEKIPYRIKLDNAKTIKTPEILNLKIPNYMGQLIPLKHFAHFEDGISPAAIHHYNGHRSVTITADIRKGENTSLEVNNNIREKYGTIVKNLPGFEIVLGGEEKKTQESFANFFMALSFAMLTIYLVLVLLFDSYFQPLLIMIAIPFAILGVFVTFIIHGLPLGFLALIGMLGLIGIVVNDSIVLIDHLNHETSSKGKNIKVIADAAADRFRPIILTTLSTVAGLMPTAYGIGGDIPIIRPMILALAWGLLFATFFTLFCTPILYSFFVRLDKVKNIKT